MKDYGFNPPSILGLVTVQDGVGVNVTFAASRSRCSPA